ncbi:hypothetical protein [Roseovarius aestuariivivens]|uniref:hypothetical protein n=1 Tax=Roseovarius aestuariivivens TaxID=1888910 RepID=UPI001080F3A4|nr:hypothetical protein [Roseovarius aestuariivivens]
MAKIDRRFDTKPARAPSTGHGAAQATADDAADADPEQDTPPRNRQWTLDRIERIIGSIA